MKMRANSTGIGKLWLLNFFGNAAALAAWYFWLLVPDAHGWQVAGSLVAAVCVIVLVVWLRAGTFAYFRLAEFRESGEVWRAFRHSLRHIVPLAIWAALLAALLWFFWDLRTYTPQAGVWIRQKLNAGPPPRNVTRDLNWLIVLIVFVLIPAIWLPAGTTIAVSGFAKGVARSWRVLKRPMYWVWFCVLVFVGVYIPYKLVWWIPNLDTLRKQAWTMGLRFFAAYVILITAWIALVWMVGMRVERGVADDTNAGRSR
jgi:hypothetical protein